MFKVTSCLFEAIPPSHIIIFIIRRQLVQSDALFPAVQSEASVLLAQPSRKKKNYFREILFCNTWEEATEYVTKGSWERETVTLVAAVNTGTPQRY